MTWTARRHCAWDTETTGVSVTEDRIVTAAILVRGGGRPDQTFSWVINPGIPCPKEASDVHGWTTERLQADGVGPKVALEELASKLTAALNHGMAVVGFNTGFDWSILHYDLMRNGLAPMSERLSGDPLTLIDAFVIDKAVDKYRRGKRKLKPTCEVYGVKLDDWHTAEADALAALGIAEAITAKYPRVADMAPVDLFKAQQVWAADQARSLQEYFRSEKAGDAYDPTAVIDGSWPLKAGAE